MHCSGGAVHCATQLGGTVGEYIPAQCVERAGFLWREVYTFFFDADVEGGAIDKGGLSQSFSHSAHVLSETFQDLVVLGAGDSLLYDRQFKKSLMSFRLGSCARVIGL